MSKNTRTRILLTAVAALLLVVMSVAGTLAYLNAETDKVVNEFTPADINLTLTEDMNTDTDEDGKADAWTAQLIPGKSYPKNPKVTITADPNNVASYLFVKVEGAADAATYLNFTIFYNKENTAWEALGDSYPGVYVLKLDDTTVGYSEDLIKENAVVVKTELDQDDTKDADFDLTFQAWVIQQYGFDDAEDAWTTGLNSGN